jgi:hypothetical protein
VIFAFTPNPLNGTYNFAQVTLRLLADGSANAI